MSIKNLGIIGGGQLGSLLAVAAKKLDIKILNEQEFLEFVNLDSNKKL